MAAAADEVMVSVLDRAPTVGGADTDAGQSVRAVVLGVFLQGATTALVDEIGTARLPFLTRVGAGCTHDDREQFRLGVEIILTGISTL